MRTAEDPVLPGDLTVLAYGWQYHRDGRLYWLTGWPVVDLEAHIAGRSYWRRFDLRVVACREDLALEVARQDGVLAVELAVEDIDPRTARRIARLVLPRGGRVFSRTSA